MADIDEQDISTATLQKRVDRNEFWAGMIEQGVRFTITQASVHDVIGLLL
jgi:hypothetical protein